MADRDGSRRAALRGDIDRTREDLARDLSEFKVQLDVARQRALRIALVAGAAVVAIKLGLWVWRRTRA